MQYSVISAPTYDAQVKLKGETIQCCSKQQLKRTYPRGGCKVVGEISGKEKRKIGILPVGKTEFSISSPGAHSSLLWRETGYLQVGRDEYIAVLKSRVPFLLLLLGLLAAIVLLLGLLMGGEDVIGPGPDVSDGPTVIAPDHPLPPIDSGAEKLEGDSSEKAEAEKGGGSVSMIYSLDASIVLSTGDITIYFQNPNASTHNVSVDMYIVSGGQEYLIAQSGLLEAGYGLSHLTMMKDGPTLSEGLYTGLFRLQCYDPVTGEKAIIVPEIAGLNITVTQ